MELQNRDELIDAGGEEGMKHGTPIRLTQVCQDIAMPLTGS